MIIIDEIKYYKLIGKTIHFVPSLVLRRRHNISVPTADDFAKVGAYPREESSLVPPKVDEGYRAVADGYELINNKWVKKWKVEVKDA